MGTMVKRAKPPGVSRLDTNREQNGSETVKPPACNTGVIQNTSLPSEITDWSPIGSDRTRLNLSLPSGVDAFLTRAASALGMTRAQVALHLVLAGLPDLRRLVDSVDE